MSRKWWSIIVEFVFVVVSLYIHWLSRLMMVLFCFFIYLVFYLVFIFFLYATCVLFRYGGVALLSAVFIFVSCGSGGGIDVITNTVLAQSFLTPILRVGVCVIVSLIFTRVLAHGFCRAR